MSIRLIRSIRLNAQSSYTWRYFSGGWFCSTTVPRMEVTASRMMIQIASFIEIRKFQIRVAAGLARSLSSTAERGARSVRTSDAVSIGTPSFMEARKMFRQTMTYEPVPAGTGGQGTKKSKINFWGGGGSGKKGVRRT